MSNFWCHRNKLGGAHALTERCEARTVRMRERDNYIVNALRR